MFSSRKLDNTILALAVSFLVGWGIWVTRKAFESHECNRELRGQVENIKVEIKGELEVLRERMKNIIERLDK